MYVQPLHDEANADVVISKIDISPSSIRQLIGKCLGLDRIPRKLRVITDTSDFFRVDYNDVVILANRPYYIRNCEREGRFGLDDEPKYWVKRAIDLIDGTVKIIKLVFHEQLTAKVGDIVFNCVRSPQKEAAILDLVKDHDHFMHGVAVKDTAENVVRILDYIKGPRLDDYIFKLCLNHEQYYYTHLPELLTSFSSLISAIKFLHDHGHKHGDIRRDHILRDRQTNNYRWIDFDFDYFHESNMFGYDLFGLGNILIFIVGGGDVTIQNIAEEQSLPFNELHQDDLNIIFNNRLANLKKIYPYIDTSLNNILLHFSNGAKLFYDDTDQLLLDLQEVSIH